MGRLFKRHTTAQKSELCEEWSASGLSQSEFCRQKDLKIATFSTWLKKFNSNKNGKVIKKAAKKETNFIPLSLSASTSQYNKEVINGVVSERLEITLLDKIVVSLPANADESFVLKILKGLAQCI